MLRIKNTLALVFFVIFLMLILAFSNGYFNVQTFTKRARETAPQPYEVKYMEKNTKTSRYKAKQKNEPVSYTSIITCENTTS